ncbi:polysaccharide deacetylase family protein [Tessaracoccus antarcticus]|nr:polysaccharide deacetylase family protein [Tessaracoccus antarcticus]
MRRPTPRQADAVPDRHDIGRLRLAVAIPTYRRLESLEKLLGVLAERVSELSDRFEVSVIVVDNDSDASARDIVTQGSWGVPVHYAHEPTPGIAAARSRLLAEASEHGLLVFIDDDEWPTPGWLTELVHMWEKTGATAVMGRVETILPKDVDPWVRAVGIFERAKRLPGERLPAAATGNLLLDLNQVRHFNVDFDPTLGTSGGEDTLFTRTLVARGGTIVACPASVALDEPGLERATRSFTLRRARFHGVTQADIDLRLATSPGRRLFSRLRSTAKGSVWIALGSLRGLKSLVSQSLADSAWSARRIQRGLGLLHGAWGSPPGEYARGPKLSHAVRLSHLKSKVRSASPFFRSVVGVDVAKPVVVLTLDDGPDPHWTPLILDLLKSRGVSATFFVLLTRVRRHPELLARIVKEGHDVGLHGIDHRRITTLNRRDLAAQLNAGRRELEAAIGAPVRWYRPPYGAMTPTGWLVVRRAGLTPVLWAATALDGRDATMEERIGSAVCVRAGDIVLAHDSRAGHEDGADDPLISYIDRVALIEAILDAWAARNLTALSLEKAWIGGPPRRAMVMALKRRS